MAGLTVVAEMIGMIGAAARLAASDLAKATEAAETYNAAVTGGSATSSMPSAGGNGGGMGASSGGASGSAGMSGGNQIATAMVTELQRRTRR